MSSDFNFTVASCFLGNVHVKPISTHSGGGADYAHHILMSPPSFESHRRDWTLPRYNLNNLRASTLHAGHKAREICLACIHKQLVLGRKFDNLLFS